MGSTISLKNVLKEYPGGTTAVKGISFEVPKGSVTCLIGPSGCGKTTTLRMINRLIELSDGEILIDGASILSQDPVELRRKIGYVIQKVGLMPHMTVERNIGLLAEVQKVLDSKTKKRIRELMETVGLDPSDHSTRYPSGLSGGQQQRVGIARALLMDPPMMLMDEPFGALDPITRSSIQEEFLSLNQKLQKTIVIVTHDLVEAFKMGDQVILMNAGEIVQKGTKEDFVKRPANDFVRKFVASQAVPT